MVTKELIADELFNFMKKYFNEFDMYKNGNNWWFGKSWSPFVQACFLIWGEKLGYKLGASYKRAHLPNFLKKIKYPKIYQKPTDFLYDISWHDRNYEFYLGLEHEETGSTAEKQMKEIGDEIEKLRRYKGTYKIIVARPYYTTKQTYQEAEKYYKEKIEEHLLRIEPPEEENWIVIFIGIENNLASPPYETNTLFSYYIWEKKALSQFLQKDFKIKLGSGNKVVKG